MIGRVVRFVVSMGFVTLAAVVFIDVLKAEDERGEHSIVLIGGVIGAFVLAQIVSWLIQANPDAWHRERPLVQRSPRQHGPQQLAIVRENQGMIVAAVTGSSRSRARLIRRLERLGCTNLDRLEHAATPDDILDTIDQLLTEAEGEHVV